MDNIINSCLRQTRFGAADIRFNLLSQKLGTISLILSFGNSFDPTTVHVFNVIFIIQQDNSDDF